MMSYIPYDLPYPTVMAFCAICALLHMDFGLHWLLWSILLIIAVRNLAADFNSSNTQAAENQDLSRFGILRRTPTAPGMNPAPAMRARWAARATKSSTAATRCRGGGGRTKVLKPTIFFKILLHTKKMGAGDGRGSGLPRLQIHSCSPGLMWAGRPPTECVSAISGSFAFPTGIFVPANDENQHHKDENDDVLHWNVWLKLNNQYQLSIFVITYKITLTL